MKFNLKNDNYSDFGIYKKNVLFPRSYFISFSTPEEMAKILSAEIDKKPEPQEFIKAADKEKEEEQKSDKKEKKEKNAEESKEKDASDKE